MKVHAKPLTNAAALSQASATAGRADDGDTTFGDTLSTLSDGSAAKEPPDAAPDGGRAATAATGTAAGAALLLFAKGTADRQATDPSVSTTASSSAPLGFLDLVQVAASSKSVSAGTAVVSSSTATSAPPVALVPSDPSLEGLVAGAVAADADKVASPAAGSTKASEKTSSSKTASAPEAATENDTVASPIVAVDPVLVPIVTPIVPQTDNRQTATTDADQGAVSLSSATLVAQASLASSMVKISTKSDEPASLPVIGDVRFEAHLAPTSTLAVTAAKPNAPVSLQTNGQSADTAANAADAPAAAGPSVSDTGSSSKSRASSDTLPASDTAAVVSGTDGTTVPAQGVAVPLSLPARAVLKAVTSLAAAASSSAVTDAPDTIARTTPARTMLLQLTPGDLGTVSVRLHLTGHTLDVALTASSAQTTGLLSRERDALGSALRSQDYQVNSLVIQGADAQASGDSSPQSGGFGASTQDMPQGQGASDKGSGLAGNGGHQAQDDQPRRQDKSQASATAASSSGDRASGLFL